MIVRFAKRRTAWESTSAYEIAEAEFRKKDGSTDLFPSVYDIQLNELTRAFAEHAAAAPIEVQSSSIGIELKSDKLAIRKTSGSAKFQFIHDAHCEILVKDTQHLIAIIEDFLKERIIHDIKKADVVRYAEQRIQCQDAEWKCVVEESPSKKWIKALVQVKEEIKATDSA